MYSLNCSYFNESFNSINELVNHVMMSGMDPNYEITLNGVGTASCDSELVWENDLLYCRSSVCGEQAYKSVEHFAKTMKIKGRN